MTDPILRGALALSLLALLGRAGELGSATRSVNLSQRTISSDARVELGADAQASAPCPRGTLPDGNACVPVPNSDAIGAHELIAQQNEHHDRSGQLRTYDQIPLSPDRPRDFRKYRLPVPVLPDQSFVTSGYDLDRPDAEQRRGSELKAVGHGGVDLAQARGTEVHLVNLENQVGDAEVLAAGHLFGNSVVTHHTLREGGVLREYLVIYGHLESAAPGLSHGQDLKAGALLGYVGDSGSPGVVHLHLEIRRAREGVDAGQLPLGQVNQNAKTIACDPRNVLELLPNTQ
ncbi:MAG TPA: M23 family metallopeptidase [Polyangiaceae bacterium]|jgi:murein DD-endopeptidase MepM/ murein hydrolase activator NlpD|nr:M23 family metallopeptidase [Polyangiaceae bacterium]